MQIYEAPLNYSNTNYPHGHLDILIATPSDNNSNCNQVGVLIVDGARVRCY